MIVDTHSFFGKLDRLGITQDSTASFRLPRFKDQKFITILIDPYRNEKGIERILEEEKFLGAYLFFDPNPNDIGYVPEKDSPETIGKLAKMDGIIGLKSLPSVFRTRMDDKLYFPFYEIAQENGLPVLMHCAAKGKDFDSVEMVKEVYKQFPKLKLILAHFGGGKKEYREKAIELAKDFPNVFLNTTAMDPLRSKRVVINGGIRENTETGETREEVLETFEKAIEQIPNQILAGSDLGYYPPEEYTLWPVTIMSEEISTRIYRDNVKRAFGEKLKDF